MRIQSDSWPTNQPNQAQPSPAQSGLIGQHLTSLDSGPLPKFNYHRSFYLCIKYSNLYFWCVDESFWFQKLIYHHEERKEGWKVVLMNIIIFYSKKLWKEIWYLIFTRPLPCSGLRTAAYRVDSLDARMKTLLSPCQFSGELSWTARSGGSPWPSWGPPGARTRGWWCLHPSHPSPSPYLSPCHPSLVGMGGDSARGHCCCNGISHQWVNDRK